MSYLTRISARIAGSGTNSSVVMPKGLNKQQPAAIARMEETEEEEETLSAMRMPAARPLRRQETEEEKPEVQRQPSEEDEEEVAPLRRQEAEEEEELAALRRQETAAEEEELTPMRRQVEEEEEEEIQPLRTIARQEEVPLEDAGQTALPPTQASLEPGTEPVSQEFAGEEEPSDLQALHRDRSSALTQSYQRPVAHVETPESRTVTSPSLEVSAPPSLTVPDFPDSNAFNNVPPQTSGSNDSRPNVIIDQLDVLIHEPALPAVQSTSCRNRDRSLRARYLRRL